MIMTFATNLVNLFAPFDVTAMKIAAIWIMQVKGTFVGAVL